MRAPLSSITSGTSQGVPRRPSANCCMVVCPEGEERLLSSFRVYRTNRPWARPGLLNRTLNNPAQNISEPSVQPMDVPPAPGPISPYLPFPPAFLPCRQALGNCCQGGLGLSLPACTMIRAQWSLLKMSPLTSWLVGSFTDAENRSGSELRLCHF